MMAPRPAQLQVPTIRHASICAVARLLSACLAKPPACLTWCDVCRCQLARLAEAAVSCSSGAFSRAFAGDAAGGAALLSVRMTEELDAVTPADLLQVMQTLQNMVRH